MVSIYHQEGDVGPPLYNWDKWTVRTMNWNGISIFSDERGIIVEQKIGLCWKIKMFPTFVVTFLGWVILGLTSFTTFNFLQNTSIYSLFKNIFLIQTRHTSNILSRHKYYHCREKMWTISDPTEELKDISWVLTKRIVVY